MNNELNQPENESHFFKILLAGVCCGFVISSLMHVDPKAEHEVPDRFATNYAITQDEAKPFNLSEFDVKNFILSAIYHGDSVSSVMQNLDSETGIKQNKSIGCDGSVSKKERKHVIFFLENIDGKPSEVSSMTISLHDKTDAYNQMGCGVQKFMINISSQ